MDEGRKEDKRKEKKERREEKKFYKFIRNSCRSKLAFLRTKITLQGIKCLTTQVQ